jgi:ParB-like nuclease domain
METLRTMDYSIFKSITSNREVSDSHVKKLVKAIRTKNLLHLNPIIVNFDYEVIDGQHRLEAAKVIGGIYIYYVIDQNVSKSDIALINSNYKNWSAIDYINYWAVEKKPGFDKLSSFISENPFISPSAAIGMLTGGAGKSVDAVRDGKINVSNYDEAVKVAKVINEYRNIFDHAYEGKFIKAVIQSLRARGYSHTVMQQKLSYQSRSLVRCVTTKQYVALLEEIYNHKLQTKIKF